MATRPDRGPILIVDDEPMVVRLLARALQHAGFRTVTRETSFGLTALVAAERPTVVILDVCMPGLDGPGVWRVARGALTPPPRVIFHSAAPPGDLEGIAAEFAEAGALSKPVSLPVLVAAVEAAHRATGERRAAQSQPPSGGGS